MGASSSGKGYGELKHLLVSTLLNKLDFTKASALAPETLGQELRVVVRRLCETENPGLDPVTRDMLVNDVLASVRRRMPLGDNS